MDISEDLARRLVELWFAWQANRPSHQRLLFTFHNEVVTSRPEFEGLSLLDTLAVLNTVTGISAPTR